MNTPIPPGLQPSSNFQSADINVLKINGNVLYNADFFSPFPNSNSDIIALPNNIYTKIEFINNSVTSNNLAISSDSVFTCLNGGFYTIICSTTFFADSIPSSISIRDNDTQYILAFIENTGITNNLTCVIYLNQNQNFIIEVNQTSGSSKNIYGPTSFGVQFNVSIQKMI